MFPCESNPRIAKHATNYPRIQDGYIDSSTPESLPTGREFTGTALTNNSMEQFADRQVSNTLSSLKEKLLTEFGFNVIPVHRQRRILWTNLTLHSG
jgi:hypothetical protein